MAGAIGAGFGASFRDPLLYGAQWCFQKYKESIAYENLNFTDDEHEKFIRKNIDDFKRLDASFITKVFFTTVKKNHIKALQVILQEMISDINVLIDAQDKYGNTALIYAASEGHKEVVEILLKNKVIINARNKKGETALTRLSITKETIEIVDLLSRKEGIEITDDITRIETIAKYANKLIKKLAQETTKEQRQQNTAALVFYPLKDHNGAFSIMRRIDYVKTLERYYGRVKIKHPTSEEQIKKKLKQLKWDILLITGHGSSEGICFTEDFSLLKENIRNIFYHFKKGSQDSQIVLNSCFTGKVRGIAELIGDTVKCCVSSLLVHP